MKDARSILDAVRATIPPNAKLLVVWIPSDGGIMRCAQANTTLGDIEQIGVSLQQNVASDKITRSLKVDRGT